MTSRTRALLLERTFEAPVPVAVAWAHLADPARWPSWARHIRRIDMEPPGAVGPGSSGVIHLSNGVRSRFAMTSFEPGRSWCWTGGFLGSTIWYDHVFEALAPDRTRIRFAVAAAGWSLPLLRISFGPIYARQLDRALPHLVEELAALARR